MGASQALYGLLLKTAGGPANGQTFQQLASSLRLAPLLERAGSARDRPRTLAALLVAWAEPLQLSVRCRPAAHPLKRLETVAVIIDRLWPSDVVPSWPPALHPGAKPTGELKVQGLGTATVLEMVVNAVLPVAVAAKARSLDDDGCQLASLPAPATYGRFKRLEEWLTCTNTSPFRRGCPAPGRVAASHPVLRQGPMRRLPAHSVPLGILSSRGLPGGTHRSHR